LVLPLAASLALPNNADDVSGAAVASLLAQSVLGFASRGRRGLALRRAEIVLWLETILASHEAESREKIVDFATHIAFEEAILSSQGTFIASCAALIRWREAELVSFEIVGGSSGACLASREAIIGSQRTFVVSRTTLSCWREAKLVSVETVIGSRRACLAVIPLSRNTYLVTYSVFRSYSSDLPSVFDQFQFHISFSNILDFM